MHSNHKMSLYSRNIALLSLLLLFLAKHPLPFVVKAQEAPVFTTAMYDPIFKYRQNVCDRHQAYYAGEVDLRDTLKGLELRVLIGVSSTFELNEDGVLDPQYPGLLGVLLDELALRAGFTWRNSYGVFYHKDGTGGENRTWSDFLAWGTETYDVCVDWWNKSLERLSRGIGFPEGFYDASYVLIGKQGKEGSTKFDLFNFLKPFSMTLWWAILGTTIVSILVYMVIEGSPNNEAWNVGWNLYLGILMFTQHFSYDPVSAAGRLFGASMAFWSLLIIVAYTANLASFFVVQNAPSMQINSLNDAIRANMRICTWSTAASDAYAREQYPQGIFIGKNTEQESLLGIKDGECDLTLMSLQTWEQYQSDREVNGDCDLEWVGRVVKFVEGGFGVKNDAGTLCTSLIHDVLNVHLVEMHSDGFIANAWQEFYAKSQDLDCDAEKGTDEEDDLDSLQLSLSQMAGTFIVHACVGLGAIFLAVGTYLRRVLKEKQNLKNIGNNDTGKSREVPTSDPLDMLGETEHEKDENANSFSYLQGQMHDLRTTQEDTNNNLKYLSAAQEKERKEMREEMAKMMVLLKAMYRKQANQERSQSQSLFRLSQIQISQSDHLQSSLSEFENTT